MSAIHFLRSLLCGLTVLWLLPAFGQQVEPLFTNYEPKWSPDGQMILFTSSRAGKAAVYVMDKDGTNQTRLTPNDASHSNAAWSPDGKRILYLAERAGTSSLYVTDPAGSYHQNISPPNVTCYAPVWSPDGSTIAFQGLAPGNSFSGLFVTAADGSDWQRLAAGEAYHFAFPEWVPGSRSVTCTATSQHGISLRTIDLDGTPSRRTIKMKGAGLIKYSPVGPAVLLAWLDGLYVAPEPQARPVRLTKQRITQYDWHPDGKAILYINKRPNGKNAIFLHDLASGAARQLTPGVCRYANASLSPDGKTLLYNCDASGLSEIYTADADGTNPKQLTHYQKLVSKAPVTVYFNQDWRITKKESHRYYRKGSLDTNRTQFEGAFEDYDSTGRLLLGGTYAEGRKNGPCTTYHLDGSKASQGQYLNNVMHGRWEYYYPTGRLKQVLEFTGDDYRILSFSDSLGNPLVTGGTGTWYDYFGEPPQDVQVAGRVVNGLREGRWTVTGSTGVLLLEEEFKAGKFIKGTEHSRNGSTKYQNSALGKQLFAYPHLELAESLKVDKCFYGRDAIDYALGKDPFKHVDPNVTAFFPGGDALFQQFMAKNLRFPAEARHRHAGGTVEVECIVDETGRLSEFKIKQGVAPELNFEVIRVLKLSPPWLPARLPDGTPQKARVIVPVLFRYAEAGKL